MTSLTVVQRHLYRVARLLGLTGVAAVALSVLFLMPGTIEFLWRPFISSFAPEEASSALPLLTLVLAATIVGVIVLRRGHGTLLLNVLVLFALANVVAALYAYSTYPASDRGATCTALRGSCEAPIGSYGSVTDLHAGLALACVPLYVALRLAKDARTA